MALSDRERQARARLRRRGEEPDAEGLSHWRARALRAEAENERLLGVVERLTAVTFRDGLSHEKVTARDVTEGRGVGSRAAGVSSLSSASSLHKEEEKEHTHTTFQVAKDRDGLSHEKVTARDVTEALSASRDLVGDELLEPVAARIVRAVLDEPAARRDGVTPLVATREAIAAAREWFAEHPQATQAARLARIERHATDFVLRDCRMGKRRVEASPSNGAAPKPVDPYVSLNKPRTW